MCVAQLASAGCCRLLSHVAFVRVQLQLGQKSSNEKTSGNGSSQEFFTRTEHFGSIKKPLEHERSKIRVPSANC